MMVEGADLAGKLHLLTPKNPATEKKRRYLEYLLNKTLPENRPTYSVYKVNGFWGVAWYSFDNEGYLDKYLGGSLSEAISLMKIMLKDMGVSYTKK